MSSVIEHPVLAYGMVARKLEEILSGALDASDELRAVGELLDKGTVEPQRAEGLGGHIIRRSTGTSRSPQSPAR